MRVSAWAPHALLLARGRRHRGWRASRRSSCASRASRIQSCCCPRWPGPRRPSAGPAQRPAAGARAAGGMQAVHTHQAPSPVSRAQTCDQDTGLPSLASGGARGARAPGSTGKPAIPGRTARAARLRDIAAGLVHAGVDVVEAEEVDGKLRLGRADHHVPPVGPLRVREQPPVAVDVVCDAWAAHQGVRVACTA